jgi:hypothetical protein
MGLQEKKQVEESIEKHKQAVKEVLEVYFDLSFLSLFLHFLWSN